MLPNVPIALGRTSVVITTNLSFSEWTSEEEKKAWIAETLNAFVNVFRPLLKDLTEQEG